MLPNVNQKTIKPIITTVVVKGTIIYTDEYSIYARLPVWGYQHKTVCHAWGEYARDDDGDGFCEVHVNTVLCISRHQSRMKYEVSCPMIAAFG